jgi:two-component system response regulator YcbB
MRIFLVEDDINVIKLLERIIKDRQLGDIVGYATDGTTGLRELQAIQPDLALVDLLMPGMDGISLVQNLKESHPQIQCIMLSQVSTKDMIAKAYEKGVEFYINKPINAIEVESVIRKVCEQSEMKQTLEQIRRVFQMDNQKEEDQIRHVSSGSDDNHCIKDVMGRIGIIGEAGSIDFIRILRYLIDERKNMADYSLKELCVLVGDHPKSVEQRLRRTAQVGLVNLANLGIEDYMNEDFVEYASSLYSFEQVKKEMDYIRGKNRKGGSVNLKKFFEGLLYYCED